MGFVLFHEIHIYVGILILNRQDKGLTKWHLGCILNSIFRMVSDMKRMIYIIFFECPLLVSVIV
jgi:hypothetical protein